ncbi:uncharacterized protein BXIN_1307 [Babesia sp. Xinjiang]|uniref:uncharacterized protein n=1 Tax=Babesia sp. Xinjiang TaxID=462227 RepID=UPI000A21ACEE|nr:uncharacterized protein BXIN_1307 [Babesia sp. Xinjiang]ORM40155.1 hypothetical protein BXIN_1307 [Babesia sp. Xinjiang]
MDDADSFASDAEVPPEKIERIHKNVLNAELEKEVENAFELFDSDGNGELSLFECQAAFRALRLNASRSTVSQHNSLVIGIMSQVKTMFAELNKGEDDTLTLSDFKTLVLQVIHKRYNAGEAAKIFALLEDGTEMSVDDDEINLMVTEASNGKDYVTYEEFKKVLKLAWRGGPMDDYFED